MKPSNNSSHNHHRFGTSFMRKLKRCFSCYKPTELRSKEKYKGKMSCNLSEKTSCGDGGYSEMIQNAISHYKDSLIKGDAKANETLIEESETEAKVFNIPSPCSMDIDSQTNNQLPQVINGVPKGLRIEDVLVRIAVLLLIRDKVKAASEKPGTPLFPDDIVSHFPGLKSGRHGYGRWQAIVDDKGDLKVQEVICQELNLPVVTLPVPGASRSQDGANVVSAETLMNETKGTVVGNDLAVDATNRAPDATNRSQLFQYSSSLHHYREMQRRQVEFIKKKVLFLEKLLNIEYQKKAFVNINERAREQREPSTTGHWEEKELVSRDGQAKLKGNVFFASFDQRSDKAAGESACTALAAVIANWLQSNQDNMPTRAQFDRLIVEGSSEWRKVCDNQDLINQFPDKHFDIETVLQVGLCPILVLHEKSFIGFFGPEKFETLKGVMSFDQI
ncbi:CHD3-type chromatin-remodeling factor PICKLE [Camellia lanceoleosa]|nr:CHD3-type chromatin-remodeling factor PICKLE [Camellia lanceoleosa]